MITSDEKECSWLIKGGEDLRLDQRIQQLFKLFNGMLAENSFCRKFSLEIVTYEVVPMSSGLGIIEWVDALPLASCYETDSTFATKNAASREEYCKLYPLTKNYLEVFEHSPSPIFARNLQNAISKTPESFLRRYFTRLLKSPEAFYKIRLQFAKSWAVSCISSYLLGIGDRQ